MTPNGCPHPHHRDAGRDWRLAGGSSVVCGVCHPPAPGVDVELVASALPSVLPPATGGGLVELAADIRAEHDAFERDARSAIAHAVRAGELLIEAKAQVRHGEWLPWLEANFPATERTARNYMRLAANRQHVSDLDSVRAGLAELAEPRPEPEPARARPALPPGRAERHLRAVEPTPPGKGATAQPTPAVAASPAPAPDAPEWVVRIPQPTADTPTRLVRLGDLIRDLARLSTDPRAADLRALGERMAEVLEDLERERQP